ncbi:MAG: restriction endonuclease subunit S [Rhodoferax sp.]|nr:restriction endonuclease subunit S [Rhodoferax sp.]
MNLRMLLSNLNLLATAPGGMARLRELILTLAVQGKLVPQDPQDEPAGELLKKIRAEKDRLIAEGKIKRDKPLAEIAEEEKPFELPLGWNWVRLAEVAFPQAGFAFKSGGFNEVRQGLPLIRIRDVGESDPSTFFSSEYREEFVVESGDWLISMDGEFRVREWLGPKALLNQRVTRLIFFGEDVFRPFVTAALQFKLSELQGTKAYTTVDHLSGGQIALSVIALPPLAEQSRIVTRVEELMRLCDALEAKGQLAATQHAQLVSTLLATLTDSETPAQLAENWHRIATHFDLLLDRPEAVDALEQTILQLAVRGLLVPQDPQDEPASELLKKIRAEKDKLIAEGKIKRDKPLPPIAEDEQPFALPSGWEWTQTGYLVNDSEAGWSPTCIGSPRRSGHWGVLKVSAVSWGAFDANANKELPADLTPRPEYEVQGGDFLLSRANTEELVARSVVVGTAEPKLMLSDKIIRLEVSSLTNRDFLNLCNNANHARVHYIANASGTSSSMKNVSREVVLRTPVPLPPLAEQSRIVTRVAQLRRLCADLRQRLAASQSTQAHLAEALVQEVALEPQKAV